MAMTKEDHFILAKIYIGLLSENQCEMVFTILQDSKRDYMKGTMPYGTSFYYSNERMLDQEVFDEIKNLEIDDPVTTPKLIRHISRYILKTNGGMEGGVPAL